MNAAKGSEDVPTEAPSFLQEVIPPSLSCAWKKCRCYTSTSHVSRCWKRPSFLQRDKHGTALLSDPVIEEDLKTKGISLDECWTGHDCTAQFLQSLVKLRKAVADLEYAGKDIKTVRWTVEDRKAYKAAQKCHICDEAFGRALTAEEAFKLDDYNAVKWAIKKMEGMDESTEEFERLKKALENGEEENKVLKELHNKTKCIDHDHLTHKVRGAAHRGCNVKDGRSEYYNSSIPIIVHNARGYDAHVIILALSQMGIDDQRYSTDY